jgi:hypothetical protein
VLATIAGLALTIWSYVVVGSNASSGSRRVIMAGVLPLALTVSAVILPQTLAGSKLLASMGVIDATSQVGRGGLKSKQARNEAWKRVWVYTTESWPRSYSVSGSVRTL